MSSKKKLKKRIKKLREELREEIKVSQKEYHMGIRWEASCMAHKAIADVYRTKFDKNHQMLTDVYVGEV